MRSVVFVALSLSLAACVSAPAPSRAPAPPRHTTAPPPDAARLIICPGHVSNAPQSDGRGRITGLSPYAEIGGAYLMRAPVYNACVSSGYGPRRGGAGSFHKGVDLFTRGPSPVIAGGHGVVEYIGTMRGYGRTIIIRHNARVKTLYAHLSETTPGLNKGARVSQGAMIGKTGRTGNATAIHLHYEIQVNGQARNPLEIDTPSRVSNARGCC